MGMKIPDNKFVLPASVITTQQEAENLPDRITSPYEKLAH